MLQQREVIVTTTVTEVTDSVTPVTVIVIWSQLSPAAQASQPFVSAYSAYSVPSPRVDHNPRFEWIIATQSLYGKSMTMRLHIKQQVRQAHQARQCYTPRSNTERVTVRRMAESCELVTPHRGMYAEPEYWSMLNHISKVQHIGSTLCREKPGTIIAGISAAAVWGLDHSAYLHKSGVITIAKPYGNPNRATHSQLRRIYLPARHMNHVTMHNNTQVTDPTRTLFDCGRTEAFHDAFPVFESAIRQNSVDSTAFLDYCSQAYVGRNRHLPAFVMSKARGLSENGGESFALAVIFELGFPWPEQQVEFTCIGPDGARKVRRVDFAWYLPDGRIVVGELDGQQKYVDPSMTGGRSIAAIVEDERERSQMLYRCGVSAVVRFTFDDVVRRAPLERKLREAGVPCGAPPVLPQPHGRR